MRQMLGAGKYKKALHGVLKQEDIETGMGPYFPRGRDVSISAHETARPYLIEKV